MDKLRIFFNEKVRYIPYGGGVQFLSNFVNFLKEKEHDIALKLKGKIDLIFILSNSSEIDNKIRKFKRKNPDVKVLHRINECDKRKNANHIDKIVFKNNEIADETVFISNWLAEYFIEKGFNKSYKVIYNGANPNFFFPKNHYELSKEINLVTHHISNHWMKGFDIYIELDKILNDHKEINFKYIGNYYDYKPLNTKVLPPLYGMEIGNELRKCDIYLTASRWEPCGMHHIEGACCGLPVLYHRDGGGINESCKNYGLEYSDIPSLLEGINKIRDSYQEFCKKIPYEFLSSERVNKEFYNVIKKVFE